MNRQCTPLDFLGDEAKRFMYWQIYLGILSFINFLLPILLLALIDKPAPYEMFSLPLAAFGWLMCVISIFYEFYGFNFHGQWIFRFMWGWMLVSTLVRFNSQRALGEDVDSTYFSIFLVELVTQILLVGSMYFKRPYTKEVCGGVRRGRWLDEMVKEEEEEKADDDLDGVDIEKNEEKMEESKKIQSSEMVVLEEGSNEVMLGSSQTSTKTSEEKKKKREVEIMYPSWWHSPNPEESANFFSRISFSWLSPLISRGYRNEIEFDDLWPLADQFTAEKTGDCLYANWVNQKKQNPDNPSLLKALSDTVGKYFLCAAPMIFLQNCAQLSLPLMLGGLIDFSTNKNAPISVGYGFAFGFFAILIFTTICENAYFDRVVKAGMKVRSGLVTTIYKHALKMTHAAKQTRSIGEIVNHMATDTEKIQNQTMTLHNLWSSPFRLIIGLTLLILEVGYAGLVGFALIILAMPLQIYIVKKFAEKYGEVMKTADERIKMLNEILGGMRVLKYYTWEVPFNQAVKTVRGHELDSLLSMQYYRAGQLFLIDFNPLLLALGTFGTFALVEGDITASQAFTSLALFQQLLWPLMLLPRSISEYYQGKVSVERVENYLSSATFSEDSSQEDNEEVSELQKGSYFRYSDEDDAPPMISFDDVSCQWNDYSNPCLKNISFAVNPGDHVAIVGPTGSGKSSLISAMLGELIMLKGDIVVGSNIAYIPQQAWIFNATLKENILFGLEEDVNRYYDSIEFSQLRKDIDHQFEGGDQIEIGEKGINLSGGQRQRVSIARALYGAAHTSDGIFLFDDPLSALDAHVGAKVFNDCISSHLAEHTVVLVTNQLHFTPMVDRIIMLSENGEILEQGSHQELMESRGPFEKMYHEYCQALEEEEAEELEKQKEMEQQEAIRLKREHSLKDKEGRTKGSTSDHAFGQLVKQQSRRRSGSQDIVEAEKERKDKGKLTKEEHREKGHVKLGVYQAYISAIGLNTFLVVMLVSIIGTAANVCSSLWLAFWTEEGSKSGARPVVFFIGVYFAISGVQALSSLVASLTGFRGAVRASTVLHDNLLSTLLKAPMSFFDSTPLGRIVNRFSKDMNSIDTAIMFNLQLLLRTAFGLVGTIVVIGISTYYVLVPFVPIVSLFIFVQGYYRNTSIKLKRLDAVSRSPLYSHFSESLDGMSTIRAFNAKSRMIESNSTKLDVNQKTYLLYMSSNRWLSIRLEVLGGILILLSALNCVILRDSLSPSTVGLVMAYALQITAQLNTIVRFVTETENSFNAVERVDEYIQIKPEATRKNNPPPENWPENGEIDMDQVVVRYRPDLPPVIDDLTLHINSGEKVGIVGRTGYFYGNILWRIQ